MMVLAFSLVAVALAFVQEVFFLPVILPIALFVYVWRSRSDRWFWWLAFWSGLWVDLASGRGLGRTSFVYLLLMFLFWQWWKKKKADRL